MPYQVSRFDPEARARSLPLCAPGLSKWSVPTWCRTAAPLGRSYKSTSCWSPDVPACAVTEGQRGGDWRSKPLSHMWGGDTITIEHSSEKTISDNPPNIYLETPMVLPEASKSTSTMRRSAAPVSYQTPPSPPTPSTNKPLRAKKMSDVSSGNIPKTGSYYRNKYLETGADAPTAPTADQLRQRLLMESQPGKAAHVSEITIEDMSGGGGGGVHGPSDTFTSELGALMRGGDDPNNRSVNTLFLDTSMADLGVDSSFVRAAGDQPLTPGVRPADISKRLLEQAAPAVKKELPAQVHPDPGEISVMSLPSPEEASRRLLLNTQPGVPIGSATAADLRNQQLQPPDFSQVDVAPDGSFHLVTKAPLTPIVSLTERRSRSSTCVSQSPTELLLPAGSIVPDTPQLSVTPAMSPQQRRTPVGMSPAPTPNSGMAPTPTVLKQKHSPFSTDLGWRENTAVGSVDIAEAQSTAIPTARPTPATPYLDP